MTLIFLPEQLQKSRKLLAKNIQIQTIEKTLHSELLQITFVRSLLQSLMDSCRVIQEQVM